MLFLVYEGPDRVGKTSTRKMVEKIRNGKDIGLDRFIGSNIVYGHILNRYTNEEESRLSKFDADFSKNFRPVLIYLTAPTKVIYERIKKDGHENIDIKTLTETIIEFEKYYYSCNYEHKIRIDTSLLTQKEVVNTIVKYIEDVENK